jgi:hypothetical protein
LAGIDGAFDDDAVDVVDGLIAPLLLLENDSITLY